MNKVHGLSFLTRVIVPAKPGLVIGSLGYRFAGYAKRLNIKHNLRSDNRFGKAGIYNQLGSAEAITFFPLQLTFLCCIFALLIKKDGGIRPCEILATCANKVLHSISAQPREDKLRKVFYKNLLFLSNT